MLKNAANRQLSILTIYATFLMGFVDAYTYMKFDGVFVSAQTGNVIVVSTKVLSEEWLEVMGHFSVFIGFALGSFIGQAITEKVRHTQCSPYIIFLFVQGLLLLGLAAFQEVIPAYLMVFLLGLLAGYELVIFRKIGVTTINNGIMTGNTKNMMAKLYQRIFDRNKEAGVDFSNLLIGFLIFVFGVIVGSKVVGWNSSAILWIVFLLNTICLFLLYLVEKKVR